MEKLVSFVIPCYNAEKFIGECLESIVRQTIGIDSIEVIVVDDASTDGSLSILAEYEKKYPDSISIIAQQENGGQAVARNIGMDMVTAPYMALLDVDDWVADTFCEKMLEPAERYRPDFIGCGITEIYADENCIKTVENSGQFVELKDVETRKQFMREYTILSVTEGCLYRTEFIRSKNIRFKSYPKYEDNYWGMLILFNMESYYGVSEALLYYRVLENSNSRSRNDTRHFCRLQVELDKIAYLMEKGIFRDYYKEIRNTFLQTFYGNTLHIIFSQFDEIPMDVIRAMQSAVRELFPDYLEYYKEQGEFINPAITVAFDFPIEVWEEFKKNYLQYLRTDNGEKLITFFTSMRKNVFQE
ncbi:MAG: glycosyltransferase [Eubacterium sp.]|jgi:Glycosyltransferases involved in cell wall biogenesis|nr:glycosyltransferase [Eubacterium sp.]